MENLAKVKIDKIVFGGYGLGKRIDKKERKFYFVKFTAPGEIAEIEITQEKRDLAFGRLKKILIPSSLRQPPVCKYFGVCGGCHFQHLSYEEQLEIKKEILKEQLWRIGKIKNIPKIETVPSPQPFHYRIRVGFHTEEGKLGFISEDNKLIDIENCPIIHEKINELIEPIKKISSLEKSIKEIHVVYSPSEGESLIKLVTNKKLEIDVLKTLKENFLPSWVVGVGSYHRLEKELIRLSFYGRDYTFIKAGEYSYRVSAESFLQANYFLWDKLIELITQYVEGEICIDTFCGIGFFTIPSSKKVSLAEGSDLNGFAIADAKYNAKLNKCSNVFFFRNTPSEHLKKFIGKKVDVVIFDPPRSGLDKKDREILELLKPKRIVYLSCNPSTLARDLGILLKKGAYEYRKLYLIDMFPQTTHIESLSILELIDF
jgi:23S rRNA (uracil1939-C5)-methyltransferase